MQFQTIASQYWKRSQISIFFKVMHRPNNVWNKSFTLGKSIKNTLLTRVFKTLLQQNYLNVMLSFFHNLKKSLTLFSMFFVHEWLIGLKIFKICPVLGENTATIYHLEAKHGKRAPWSHRILWNDHEPLTAHYVVVAHNVWKFHVATMENNANALGATTVESSMKARKSA